MAALSLRMRDLARSETGYSISELYVVVALIGIMAFLAVPFLMTYVPTAIVSYSARELQSGLNRAKMLAVSTRQPICVQPTATGYQYFPNTTCTGAGWAGTGTDGNGVVTLAGASAPGGNITVSLVAGSFNPVFNQFGVAVQAGSLRVTGTGGRSQTVTVQPSGMVTIP